MLLQCRTTTCVLISVLCCIGQQVLCAFLAAAAHAAPSPHHSGVVVSPVILPKVHLASPDVTVVKQPYVIQQTEPVFRQVYYTDPLSLHVPAAYVSQHVAYHHQQPAAAVYHSSAAYVHPAAVNYVV